MGTTYPSPASFKVPNVSNVADVQVAPANLTRVQLYVFNPGPNTIWVCPSVNTDQTNLTAAVNGVGSVPIQPSQGSFFVGYTGAMRAIASAGGSNTLTIWEFYP